MQRYHTGYVYNMTCIISFMVYGVRYMIYDIICYMTYELICDATYYVDDLCMWYDMTCSFVVQHTWCMTCCVRQCVLWYVVYVMTLHYISYAKMRYDNIWYDMTLYGVLTCCIIRYDIIWYDMIWNGMIGYDTQACIRSMTHIMYGGVWL